MTEDYGRLLRAKSSEVVKALMRAKDSEVVKALKYGEDLKRRLKIFEQPQGMIGKIKFGICWTLVEYGALVNLHREMQCAVGEDQERV